MNNVFCKHHPDNQIIFIIWNSTTLKLACDECMGTNLIEGNAQEEKWKKLAIRKALKEPDYFLSQFKLNQKNKVIMLALEKYPHVQLLEVVDKIEQQIKQIQIILDKIVDQLKEEATNIRNNKEALRKQFENITHYSQLKELIEGLNNSYQKITYDIFNQVEANLEKIFIDLEKDSTCLNQEIEKYSAKSVINRNEFYSGIESLKCQIKQLQSELQLPQFRSQYIVPHEYFKEIITRISLNAKQNIKSCDLIFNEQKDNLNSLTFWNCVQNKKNLLMIFKSQSSNIFGAYTPLIWDPQLEKQYDDSLQSFLFSYTHKTIHQYLNRCKYSTRHCTCKQACKPSDRYEAQFSTQVKGPCFNSDILIDGDFQKGYSNLGTAYSIEQFHYPSNHLFGSQSPNIIECRIFEINFE